MKTTAILQLILGCLLHITRGAPLESCSLGKVILTDVNKINGLWNIKALAYREPQTFLNKVNYGYAKISVTEKEGTITESFNPMEGIYDEPIPFQRVDDEKETLTYRITDESVSGFISFISFPFAHNVLFVNHQSNGIIKRSALYVRSASHPETKLKRFREWSRCNELTLFKAFNLSVNYAQKCYGLLEEKTPLHLEETQDNITSWHLVVKSSTSMDPHYNGRILYTARLEISRKDGEITLKEIITAPNDSIILEQKLGKPTKGGDIDLNFKTEEGLLLLGVPTNTGRTLYLASTTLPVRYYVMEKFKDQAVCFETQYNYFIPGSIMEDEGDKACTHHLEKWELIRLRESVGKWILIATANKNFRTELIDHQVYKMTEVTVVDDKEHKSITIQQAGFRSNVNGTEIDVEVEENTGLISFIGFKQNQTSIHKVTDNCIIMSSKKNYLLNCLENHFPPIGDIIKFVKFTTCRNFNKILIHQPLSSLCSGTPPEVPALDVEKIAGTWKLAVAASKITDEKFPNEIQFTVNNGEVTITDGTWTGTAKKIGNNRLQYAKGPEPAMEIRFHEPLGDSLLIWLGNPTEQKIFLFLLSKSGHTRPDELIRVKHFAACLSIPVVFVKE